MTQTYSEFDSVEQDGQEYIIAQSPDERHEPVRFSGELQETDGIDATFRDVIRSLVQQDLSDALNLDGDSGGAIARSEAIQTLQDAEETPIAVGSEARAEAIVDYFIENGILREDGTDVVVLSDPGSLATIAAEGSESDEDTVMLLNWMSAIEGCTDKIQETIDTVEEVEQDLQEQMGQIEVTEKMEEYERKQKEVAQQLMNLTNGGELDKSDLTESEQAEYDRLEHRLFHLDAMIESVSDTSDLDQEIRKMTNQLSMHVENLKETQGSLDVQIQRLRKVYQVNEHIDYDEAKEMAERLADIAADVAGVASVEERKDREEDELEYAASILEEAGDTQTFGEGVEVEASRSRELDQGP
jgi:hypothetical protein